jgi:hypothetical protein
MAADGQTDFAITSVFAAACMVIASTAVGRHVIAVIRIRSITAAEWQHPETED